MCNLFILLLVITFVLQLFIANNQKYRPVLAQAAANCDDGFVEVNTYNYFDNNRQTTLDTGDVSTLLTQFIEANPTGLLTGISINTDDVTRYTAFCCPSKTPNLWYSTSRTAHGDYPKTYRNQFLCCPNPDPNTVVMASYFRMGQGMCAYFDTANKFVDDDLDGVMPKLTNSAEAAVGGTGVAECDEDVKLNNKTCPIDCPRFLVKDGINPEAVICRRPTNNPLSNPAIAANAPQILTAYGNACIPQFATCESFPGKKNLVKAIQDGSIISNNGWSMDQSTVLGDLRREFDTDLPNICIDDKITGIISFKLPWLRGADPATYIYHASNGETILRGCTTGFVPSTAPDSGAGEVSPFNSGWTITGCCKPGQQFVTPANRLSLSGVEYQNAGRCCDLNGSKLGDPNFPYQTNDNKCYNAQSGLIGPADPDLTNIAGIDFGLGSGLYSTDNTKTSLLCPATSDCVITGKDANGIPIVDSPSKLLTEKSLACFRCYENGEAVKVDLTNKTLLTCNNGSLKSNPLINDSVASTLAYLREQDVTGNENADDLRSCLARGGLYVAIGCIDPTPLGVITGLIRIAFGVMGGVALIQLILAGIAYQRGEEADIQKAREKVISTITGVALLVFSVLILRIIGINVLDVVPVGSF